MTLGAAALLAAAWASRQQFRPVADLWSSVLFDTTGALRGPAAAWITVFNCAAAVVTSIATALYLFVTFRLLVQGRKAHIESQNLTRRLHADTLTPFLFIEGLDQQLHITSVTNTDLRVYAIEDGVDVGTALVNSRAVVAAADLTLAGQVTVDLKNASDNVAETTASLTSVFGESRQTVVIPPNGSSQLRFPVDHRLSNLATAQQVLAGAEQLALVVAGNGPGISAQDGLECTTSLIVAAGASVVHVSDAVPRTEKRFREYDRKAWRYACE